jgi:RNA polymerase sigma-70 factor (ECF subfamily)
MSAQAAAFQPKVLPPPNSRAAILEAPGFSVLSEVSDYGLAQAAAAHDMRALGELYERHKHRVYAVCTRMTRSPADADDLTQEVFLHLVRKIGSYRGESQFTTWLHRLTVNCVLMYFRRPSRRENNFSELENVIPIAPRLLTPQPARIADRIAFQSAIKQLPRGCRTVFVLFEIAGYEHEEIAKLMGCSSGTSKSQLHRARMKLKQLLTIQTHK